MISRGTELTEFAKIRIRLEKKFEDDLLEKIFAIC